MTFPGASVILFFVDPNVRIINWYEYNETVIHPLSIILLLIMVILILYLKKEYLTFPLFATIMLIPDIERVVIAGLDFEMVRIVAIFGFIRIILRNEHKQLKFNQLDKYYFLYVFFISIIYLLNRKTGTALINRFGFILNMTCFYLLLRVSISKTEDLIFLYKNLVLFSVVMALAMLSEQITKINPFHIMGQEYYTVFREGRYRSQAAFVHPILAGTFGGFMLPFIWALWNQKTRNLGYVAVGLVASAIIVYTSASSGPIMTFGAACLGLAFWYLRKHMKFVRRGIVFLIILFQLIMQGPIWSLLWRFTLVSGSTGYFRYRLFDAFVNRFTEWAPLGLENNAHWGWGLQDATNMFVRVGLDGGIISLVLFVLIIIHEFKAVGLLRVKTENDHQTEIIMWSLGAFLISHVITFFGVSYFGNIIYFFVLAIAACSSLMDTYQLDYKKTKAELLSPVPLVKKLSH